MLKLLLISTLTIGAFCSPNEIRLRDDLFKDVHPEVRPSADDRKAVDVKIGFSLQRLNEIDEERQSMSVFGWCKIRWVDPNLKWNPKRFGNITHIRIDPNAVWKVDLKMFHGEIHERDQFAILSYNGAIIWILPGNFVSRCVFNFDDYPRDLKSCDFELGSWSYNSKEVTMSSSSIKTDMFKNHLHWSLTNQTIVKKEEKYSCCPHPYDYVTVSLTFRRSGFKHPMKRT